MSGNNAFYAAESKARDILVWEEGIDFGEEMTDEVEYKLTIVALTILEQS